MKALDSCPRRFDFNLYKSWVPFIYCLGAKEPQVKNIWAQEIDSNQLQFRELFLYSVDIIGLKHGYCAMGEIAFIYIYYFSNSFDCLVCRRVWNSALQN